MITIENITKSFGGEPAVKDLSLKTAKGEVFGLVGPNGAGKTTTIRMMTGLLSPEKGRIFIAGHNMATDPTGAKSVMGYVPDRAFMYEKLTASEFLIFIASVYGLKKPVALKEIQRLLVLFGIKDLEDELIEGFSQGMRQRLAFASALIHDPGVIVIDEPFTGLDPFGVRLIKSVLRDLSSRGVTVFLATHSLHIAEELCQRVGFIQKGALIAIRTREEISLEDGGLEGMFLRISS